MPTTIHAPRYKAFRTQNGFSVYWLSASGRRDTCLATYPTMHDANLEAEALQAAWNAKRPTV